MTTKKVVGHISGPQTQFYVEWKIEEYFNQRPAIDDIWISPNFALFDSTWNLKLRPKGSFLRPFQDFVVSLLLGKLEPEPPCRLTCTLGVKTNNGSIYKGIKFTNTFSHNYLGTQRLLNVDDLLDNKEVLSDCGTATFFCNMSHPEVKEVDIASRNLYLSEPTILGRDFKNLFLNEICCDITFKVQNEEIRAHSQILAARCSVFESMFTHEMKEKKTGVVDVEDCEPTAFRKLLIFLYSGETDEMSSENVIDLYCTADKYNVTELKGKCSDFMRDTMCVDSFCDVMSLAIKYQDNALIQNATECFLKEGQKIIETVDWLSFVKEFPLQSNELVIKIVKHLSH